MNRIDAIFADRRAAGRKAIMPFLTAGYPSLDVTERLLPKLHSAGASICELGFPFSDPIADGPVISASMTEALHAGFTPSALFKLVERIRSQVEVGLVAMVSYSLVTRMGLKPFVERAGKSGFDGFILPDLPLDESDEARGVIADAGLTLSLLIAPTTPAERAAKIARACSGFIYLVARTGITGERDSLPPDLTGRVSALRNESDLPIAVGFGISQAEHVRSVTQVADAAIVGSALVKRMGEKLDADAEAQAEHAAAFVKELAGGLG